jgi:glutamine synthetase
MVRDPLRGGDNILVLCECMLPDGSPHPTNTRHAAANTFAKDLAAAPWYGMEQEYTIYPVDSEAPIGWPRGGCPRPQGPYYCGVGADKAYGRDVANAHYKACLYAGLKISGINAEVMPGQWEFQIGPAEGIEAGDHMVLARYLMDRVCEDFGVVVSLDPKPKSGDWNGSGCHVNYSTKAMREDGGMEVILSAIDKLSVKHEEHIALYGAGNERRLTGLHETSSMSKFSFGVANRGASVRIPREAEAHGKGYFEDRRPASNMDPYVVTAKIFATTHLDE